MEKRNHHKVYRWKQVYLWLVSVGVWILAFLAFAYLILAIYWLVELLFI
jgi:hypothetical protein